MTTPLNPEQLPEEQRAFHAAVISAHPRLAPYFSIEAEEDGQPAISAKIPSPTGDEYRQIIIWVDAGDISVSFDIWHTHVSLCYEIADGRYLDVSLADVVGLILRDELFVLQDGDPANNGWDIWMPAYGGDRLTDFLTEPHGSGTVAIRSWSGAKDRRMSVTDIAQAS